MSPGRILLPDVAYSLRVLVLSCHHVKLKKELTDFVLALLYTSQFLGFLNWNNSYILHVMITSINSQSPWSLGRWDIAGESHLLNKTEILVLESSSLLSPDSLYYFKSEWSDFLIENSEKALGSLCSSWHNHFLSSPNGWVWG